MGHINMNLERCVNQCITRLFSSFCLYKKLMTTGKRNRKFATFLLIAIFSVKHLVLRMLDSNPLFLIQKTEQNKTNQIEYNKTSISVVQRIACIEYKFLSMDTQLIQIVFVSITIVLALVTYALFTKFRCTGSQEDLMLAVISRVTIQRVTYEDGSKQKLVLFGGKIIPKEKEQRIRNILVMFSLYLGSVIFYIFVNSAFLYEEEGCPANTLNQAEHWYCTYKGHDFDCSTYLQNRRNVTYKHVIIKNILCSTFRLSIGLGAGIALGHLGIFMLLIAILVKIFKTLFNIFPACDLCGKSEKTVDKNIQDDPNADLGKHARTSDRGRPCSNCTACEKCIECGWCKDCRWRWEKYVRTLISSLVIIITFFYVGAVIGLIFYAKQSEWSVIEYIESIEKVLTSVIISGLSIYMATFSEKSFVVSESKEYINKEKEKQMGLMEQATEHSSKGLTEHSSKGLTDHSV